MSRVALLAVLLSLSALAAQTAPDRALLVISIDGMRPDYVSAADRHGLKIPNLRRISATGAHARGVRGVLPTVTYPSHTTMMTGVRPAKHGIYENTTFDPLGRNLSGWYWYSEAIQVRRSGTRRRRPDTWSGA
jgi:predicted AlkP superfamily pyrophosphatase or phosphodiesterase